MYLLKIGPSFSNRKCAPAEEWTCNGVRTSLNGYFQLWCELMSNFIYSTPKNRLFQNSSIFTMYNWIKIFPSPLSIRAFQTNRNLQSFYRKKCVEENISPGKKEELNGFRLYRLISILWFFFYISLRPHYNYNFLDYQTIRAQLVSCSFVWGVCMCKVYFLWNSAFRTLTLYYILWPMIITVLLYSSVLI